MYFQRANSSTMLQAPLSVPFGTSEVTWKRCTLMRTLSAISTVRNWSPTSTIRPRMPPGGDDFVAGGQLAQHGLVFFLLLLLRTDQQEVEDDDEQAPS